MYGWIFAAVFGIGWFASMVKIGFSLIQLKQIIERLSELAGVDVKEVASSINSNTCKW